MIRLLHFNKAGELTYTEFSESSIPPYAILSHRWGGKEILFKHLRNGTWKEKAGGQKIEFCATAAARDGLQYFWIDTCCIDKWNVQELSRSINSMFQWYRNAQKCYVFLSDVSISNTALVAQWHIWEKDFRKSQWFTRGWTLQELIAPASVEFFCREGFLLGDKGLLEPIIHDITHIPVFALRGCVLAHFSVQERMIWAGSRTTTEPEDEVYCLLGILDVFMPASYGEGVESARERLRDALQITSIALFMVPFPKNSYFVGRERELSMLDRLLRGRQPGNRLAIVGAGGTGKSQLALEFAYRCRSEHRDRTVIWIDASTIDSLYLSYTSILQRLRIPGWDDEKVDVLQLVKDHFSQPYSGKWLLVYDNTNDAVLTSTGLSTSLSSELAAYLPGSETGCIIVTSTNKEIAPPLAISQIVELLPMTPNNAETMFEHHIERPILPGERSQIVALLQQLSYLPLAIVQAAAYIKIQQTSIEDYCILLEKTNKQGTNHTSDLPRNQLQSSKTNNPVLATLRISLEQIQLERPTAVDDLCIVACLDATDISLELLITPSGIEREKSIKTLDQYRLITRRPSESALDVHRLVHTSLRQWLQGQGWSEHWHQVAVRRLCQVFPNNENEERSKWRRLLPHASLTLSQSFINTAENGDRIDLMRKCGLVLSIDGRWAEAEQLEMQVMQSFKTRLGVNHPYTLASIANLALTYGRQGRWVEAEQLQVRVVGALKTKIGADHPDTLISIGNLASTYSGQGRWAEAEQLQVQVVEMQKTKLGADHPDTLTSMHFLACTLKALGRDKEAVRLMNNCVEGSTRVLGAAHPDTTSRCEIWNTWERKQGDKGSKVSFKKWYHKSVFRGTRH